MALLPYFDTQSGWGSQEAQEKDEEKKKLGDKGGGWDSPTRETDTRTSWEGDREWQNQELEHGGGWWRNNRYDRKREKGRQEVWLINSEGEFSVAGLLQHVGDPSPCLGLQLQRSLPHLSISQPLYHHPKTPLNTSDRCLVKGCQFIVNPALPSLLHFLKWGPR